jgi:hypothetical protein
MSIYVALPEKIPNKTKENVHLFTKNVKFYSNEADLRAITEPCLVLLNGEEIKVCTDISSPGNVFVTDGVWLAPDKRWINIEPDSKNDPIILKTEQPHKMPFLQNKKLQNLYKSKLYDEFCIEAEKVIFSHGNNDFMLDYYLALVYYFVRGNAEGAKNKIAIILNKCPEFAEAWCALGDMFVETKQLGLAQKAYTQAINKGKNRNIYDGKPVWIAKYNNYPKEMLEKINKMLNDTKVVLKGNF